MLRQGSGRLTPWRFSARQAGQARRQPRSRRSCSRPRLPPLSGTGPPAPRPESEVPRSPAAGAGRRVCERPGHRRTERGRYPPGWRAAASSEHLLPPAGPGCRTTAALELRDPDPDYAGTTNFAAEHREIVRNFCLEFENWLKDVKADWRPNRGLTSPARPPNRPGRLAHPRLTPGRGGWSPRRGGPMRTRRGAGARAARGIDTCMLLVPLGFASQLTVSGQARRQ